MGPTLFLTYVISILLGGLALLAIVSVMRGIREKPDAGPKPQKIPFIDFPPPQAVQPSSGVTNVGWAATVWAALNLLVGLLWFATQFNLQTSVGMQDVLPALHIAVGYSMIASVIGGIGGVMLLGCQAQGRRLISWGGFLFTTISVMGFGLALIVWASPSVEMSIKSVAMLMGVLMAVHLVIDAVIASMAQRVGLPPEADATEPQTPAPPEE